MKTSIVLTPHTYALMFCLLVISGCGGGTGNNMEIPVAPYADEIVPQPLPGESAEVSWEPGGYEPWRKLSQVCANPRNNEYYSDQLGTVAHENNWGFSIFFSKFLNNGKASEYFLFSIKLKTLFIVSLF